MHVVSLASSHQFCCSLCASKLPGASNMPLVLGDDVCSAYGHVIFPANDLTAVFILLLRGDFTETELRLHAQKCFQNPDARSAGPGDVWRSAMIPLAALPKVLPCYEQITTCWFCGDSPATRKCSTCWVHFCSQDGEYNCNIAYDLHSACCESAGRDWVLTEVPLAGPVSYTHLTLPTICSV